VLAGSFIIINVNQITSADPRQQSGGYSSLPLSRLDRIWLFILFRQSLQLGTVCGSTSSTKRLRFRQV
jgi:hypothetical protein